MTLAWQGLGFASEGAFLEDWLERLRTSNKLVIVEGKEDLAALKFFEIPFVHPINRLPLFELVEKIEKSGREVVILTDLDAEGKRLYGTLYTELDAKGVKIDRVLREELFSCTELRQIEGLKRYFMRRTAL